MLRFKKNRKNFIAVMLVIAMLICSLFTFSVNAVENIETQDFIVDIGGIEMDIYELAIENGVDPYELKAAIENQIGSERFSPFSDLVSTNVNPAPIETESISFSRTGSAYATVSKSNQDSTAYTAGSSDLTASGKTPAIGMAAMKISVTTKTGSTTSTIVAMGTQISLTNSVSINGTSYSTLTVEDRGSGTNRTEYWVDIFFGLDNTTNKQNAMNYGVKTISYSWTY